MPLSPGTRRGRPLALCVAAFLLLGPGPLRAQLHALAAAHCSAAALSARDSAREAVREAIRATLLTAARSAGIAEPRGLVVVMMNRDGGAPVLRIVDHNLSDAALAVAAPHVAGLAAAWPGEGRIRLTARLDPLPLPECHASRPRRRSDPRFVRPDEGREVFCQLGRRHAGRRVGLGQLVLWVALTREGRIAYAEIESGEAELIPEHELLTPVTALELRPAMLDAVPQDLLFAAQLLVRVRPEGTGPQRMNERVAGFTPIPLWDYSRDPSGCG